MRTLQDHKKRLLLAVPESDCHVVANKLVEFICKANGHEVLNLGVCTPTAEIAAAAREFQPDAIILSCQNGHALNDLATLPEELHTAGMAHLPVYAGGHLAVGATQDPRLVHTQFQSLGITVLSSLEQLPALLTALPRAEITQQGNNERIHDKTFC